MLPSSDTPDASLPAGGGPSTTRERELAERGLQHETFAALGALALSEPDLDGFLPEAMRRASRVLRGEVHLVATGAGGALEPRVPARRLRCPLVGARAGAPLPSPSPGRAAAVVQGRTGVWGVLCAHLDGDRTPSRDDVHFLETLAHTVAAAVGRHAAERALAEREREARAVFEHTQDALVTLDDAGALVAANPAARRLLGVGARRGGGPTWRAFQAEVRAHWQDLGERGRAEGELALRIPERPARTLEWSAVARILPGRHLVVLRDVTESRLVQARLALHERLASVGTLAGGLAHELNNPLSSLFANLGFTAEELEPALAGLPGGDEIAAALREAREAAERMRTVVRDLQTFSRGDGTELAEVDVRRVVETALSIASGRVRSRARLVRAFEEVAPVRAVEGRLAQVVLKLLVNAAQAIPEGAPAEHEIRAATRTDRGGRVCIEISDTGRGIAPEHLPHVFDPFFTTGAPGSGLGLGLPVCHGLVKAMGGGLEVTSEPGRGTTFRVILPPSERAQPAVREAREDRPSVLVVDAEPFVGAAVRRALAAGHDVSVAESARDALERIRAGARYDVILADLATPGIGGAELHDALAAIDPALAARVLFLTADPEGPAARSLAVRLGERCIEKPFDPRQLRERVARTAEIA
ncbi:MAG: ATP-binding protein [Anaeromyxobacter sp.]